MRPELPGDAIVLETDAPYIAPVWRRTTGRCERTEPGDLARIAAELALLRGIDLASAGATEPRAMRSRRCRGWGRCFPSPSRCPVAPLAAFVLGVCALQWQAELAPRCPLLVAAIGGADH